MKHHILLFVIIFFVGIVNAAAKSSMPDSNFESIHQHELKLHQDSMHEDTFAVQDDTQGSMTEEHADQVRVFVNSTLIIVIIIILILAVAIFLIINRVRRTRIE